MDVNAKTGELLGTRLCDKKGNIYWELLKGNFLTLSTIMVRAKCFQFIGRFDEKIPAGLDHDMWIRVSEYFLFECINQPLVKYGVHEQKLSNNLCLQIRGKEAWIEKYAYVIKNDLPTYSKLYCELGIWYCLNGNISQGRKTILHAIKRIPWQVKPFAILCSTFLGVEGFRKLVTLWATRKSILHFG